ncbi:S8 family serine peptidase [Nonomuraea spiralis]|uniref:S8 family serine peptidase n=1 Tax=Nonomuraea spiralis TaxID=46182 RepID=A0ABV5IAT0_9ACTN|nr:S8 family serine peptidase [Nonomuraea spiralis]
MTLVERWSAGHASVLAGSPDVPPERVPRSRGPVRPAVLGRVLLAAVLGLGVTAAPAAAAPADETCTPEPGVVKLPGGEPWAQKRLDIKTAWRLSTGAGVRVAVIDSGLDVKHPQLPWLAEFVDFTGTGYTDCVGHGTAVTGIIAGRVYPGVAFHGVAPRATVIELKQSSQAEGHVATLAAAIDKAVQLKADVINISIKAADNPALKAAVRNALANDIVIVAAAGNITDKKEDVPAYPGSYEGVLAVGSATPDGRRADSSNTATPVAVLGPGVGVIAPWPGGAYKLDLEGSSFGAAYVSGTAALVRARFPHLDQEQVRRRIIATADGSVGEGTGAGMVNPVQAVSAVLPFEPAGRPLVAAPPPPGIPVDAIARVPREDVMARNVSLAVTAGALILVAVAGALALVLPLGRSRGWRARTPT